MADLNIIYGVYVAAGLIAIFDRGSMLPIVLALMAAAFRVSVAFERRKP